MQQARFQEGLQHNGNTPDLVEIKHQVLTERLEIRDVRHAGSDPVEIVHSQIDTDFVRDRWKVQDSIRRATEGHHDGYRVLQGLLGDDVSCGDVLSQHLDNRFTAAPRQGVPSRIDRGG